jgi:hypothetical protein
MIEVMRLELKIQPEVQPKKSDFTCKLNGFNREAGYLARISIPKPSIALKSSKDDEACTTTIAQPPLNKLSRIAVLGGGIGGIVAARELRALGYEKVIVYEKNAKLGGKCTGLEIDGFTYNLGVHLVQQNGPIAQLAKSVGLEVRTELSKTWLDSNG